MSTNAIKLRNPFSVLFAKGIDIEDNNYKFDDEQKKSQSRADEMMEESSKPIHVNVGKANKKGGIRKKYETPKIIPAQKMTPEKLEKMSKILKGDGHEIEQ